LRLDPLTIDELEMDTLDFDRRLNDLLYYGSLPGMINEENLEMRGIDLKSYVEGYLEEEIRKEMELRKLGPFANFLKLAAIEAGNIINFSSMASDIGISKNTIVNYFEVLFDTLIAEKIEPITKSQSRKKLIKSPRFLFFDLGVRRMAAEEGLQPTPDRVGNLFEQFVGLELLRQLRIHMPLAHLKFWTDPDGPEVDWVIDNQGELIPIEVKWKENPSERDAAHLKVFFQEYNAKKGFVICRTPRPFAITKDITAIPWFEMANLSFLTT
jgi:predicted AAA+ superfamily ATPase